MRLTRSLLWQKRQQRGDEFVNKLLAKDAQGALPRVTKGPCCHVLREEDIVIAVGSRSDAGGKEVLESTFRDAVWPEVVGGMLPVQDD